MISTRTAVVTGAASGIGAACAIELAGRGWHVVIADLNTNAAVAVADALILRHHSAEAVHVDMSNPESVRALIDMAARGPGGLGALVNNAGIAIARAITEYTVDQWDLQLAVNVRGPFLAIQAAVPHFVKAGGGKIVNIVSTAAFVSSSTPESAYDVSKAGLRQLTVSASVELAPLGINVNAVAPGTIATQLTTEVLNTTEKLTRAREKIPAGRIGRPEDIAKAVAFLVSSDADYVHAHTLVVDGGWLAL